MRTGRTGRRWRLVSPPVDEAVERRPRPPDRRWHHLAGHRAWPRPAVRTVPAQLRVAGELLGGLLLGSTLFGLVAPGWQAALFQSGTATQVGLEIAYQL